MKQAASRLECPNIERSKINTETLEAIDASLIRTWDSYGSAGEGPGTYVPSSKADLYEQYRGKRQVRQ